MTHDRDDAGEDALAGVDLQAWRVPPPAAVDRASLIVRALSPAAAQARRPRLGWIIAAVVIANAAIATLIVILVPRPPAAQTVVLPAGGGSADARVQDLLERLALELRELERRLAEITELRAIVAEFQDRVRKFEDKGRDRQAPDPPSDPPSVLDACDEVSCVLSNYDGACCAKFRRGRGQIPINPFASDVPEALDRPSISEGVAAVRVRVAACADHSTAKGKVKVRVKVGANGRVTQVSVDQTPDAALGTCVAAAMKRAVFPATQNGGSFSYPFWF